MRIDDRPTIAAPMTTRICGWRKSKANVRSILSNSQNRRALEKFGGAQFTTDRDMRPTSTTGRTIFPMSSGAAPCSTMSGRNANNPRGLWRRTTFDQFRTPQPAMGKPAGSDKLAAEENQDWLLNWTQTLREPCTRDMSLSRGGSDAVELREFDMRRRRSSPMASRCRKPKAEPIGSCRHAVACEFLMAREWQLRPDMPKPCVCGGAARSESGAGGFRDAAGNMAAYRTSTRPAQVPRVWFVERLDFFNHHIWLGSETGAQTKLDLRPISGWKPIRTGWSSN